MFSDYCSSQLNVPSSWRDSRKHQEAVSQTDPVTVTECSIQHPDLQTIATQTEASDTSVEVFIDADKLVDFVKSAAVVTIQEITETLKNETLNHYLRTASSSSFTIEQTFTSKYFDQLDSQKFGVSAVAWNCNSSVLAAGFGCKHHGLICNHNSFVFLWNLYKNIKDQPTVFEVDGCVSVLLQHPKQPSVFAVATHDGRVSLWNSRLEDMMTSQENGHLHGVSGLYWQTEQYKNKSQALVSSSLDGRILLWQVLENWTLQLQSAFVVLASNLPRSLAIKSVSSEAEVGIRCISFNLENPTMFVVGCFGGALFQCSLVASSAKLVDTDSLKNSGGERIALQSPVILAMEPHRGNVNVVRFSPFSRNVLFSCAEDAELRIYNTLKAAPEIIVHTEFPLVAAEWSPSRPVIAAISQVGFVHFFLVNDTPKQIFSFQLDNSEKPLSIAYNLYDRNEQLAVGSAEGNAFIIQLKIN